MSRTELSFKTIALCSHLLPLRRVVLLFYKLHRAVLLFYNCVVRCCYFALASCCVVVLHLRRVVASCSGFDTWVLWIVNRTGVCHWCVCYVIMYADWLLYDNS